MLLAAFRAAHAVALGEVELRSRLNQPLDARIELHGVDGGQLGGIEVRLGDAAAFRRSGLERAPWLTRLRFQTHAGRAGAYLSVRTLEAVREPALSFVVELVSGGQVVQRRYDLLLSLN